MQEASLHLIVVGCVIIILFVMLVILWRQLAQANKEVRLAQRDLDLLRSEYDQKSMLLQEKREEVNTLELALEKEKEENSNFKARNAALETHKANYADQLNELQSNYKQLNEDWKSLSDKYSEARTQNQNLKEKLEQQKQELEEMGQQMKDQFSVLADKILRKNSELFKNESSEKLNQLLEPFKEKLQSLRKKVEDTYTSEKAERISLEKSIKELQGLNERLSKEADELVQALKGSSKTQGNWGEMLLESILDNSGLVKGENYFREETLRDIEGNAIKNESGSYMRPDVVVKYPDGRVIIIDSKVSLKAYVRFSEEADLEKQEKYLSQHVISIRNHIDSLSKKQYDQFEHSPEFVMMFIPIEPAYHFALQHDPSLWSYAWDRRICLMSPTNLIAALRLVKEVWKKEKQNQNAREIAERAGYLYDKFVGVYESFNKIGKHLKDATTSYEEAQSRLKDGRGSAMRQVELLKDLGAEAKKALPTETEED